MKSKVDTITNINFAKDDVNVDFTINSFSMEELLYIRSFLKTVKEKNDSLTMDGEYVGNAYNILEELNQVFFPKQQKSQDKIIILNKAV